SKADLAELIEKAKDDGSYDKLVEANKKKIDEHIGKNGGKAEDHVVQHNPDGSSTVVKKDEIPTAAAAEAADSGFDAAKTDFQSLFRTFTGVFSQSFSLNLDNGIFSLGYGSTLGTPDRDAVTGL
ncbi:MAG: hypothetical protein LIP23_07365, partial [Planctomycetes bacterium]|nr:hypothetical protein [Planctomycetota bacterium]